MPALGPKEEPEGVGSDRQRRDAVISSRKGGIPTSPKSADTAASYTWGPGKAELKRDRELERAEQATSCRAVWEMAGVGLRS